MKNPNDPIGNRNRDVPACCAVPRPTAQLRTPNQKKDTRKNYTMSSFMIRTAHQNIARAFKIKEDEMGEACSMYG